MPESGWISMSVVWRRVLDINRQGKPFREFYAG